MSVNVSLAPSLPAADFHPGYFYDVQLDMLSVRIKGTKTGSLCCSERREREQTQMQTETETVDRKVTGEMLCVWSGDAADY